MASDFPQLLKVPLGLSTIIALVLSLLPTQLASAASVESQQADAFVDSIGVNIHLHYTDTVYNDFNMIRSILDDLGIRHVRDAAYTHDEVSRDHFFYERVRELGASGILFNLITSIQSERSTRTDLELLDDIYDWTEGAVVSFEGTNEPDLFGDDDWVEATVALQQELWNTVKGSSVLNDLDVIGPSPAFEPDELPDLSAFIDYGNWHGYPGGLCVACEGDDGRTVFSLLAAHRGWSGSAPVMVTETGYHTAVEVSGSEAHAPVSEEAQAKYLPRLLLEYFNSGIARTYIYELMDLRDDPSYSDRESHFGLVRNDGTPKPAYTAVRNLITILEDPGPSFEPGSLEFGLSGNTDGLHTTLLQKRDGTFYLALWREEASYDIEERTNIGVRSRGVALWVDSAAVFGVYRPNESPDLVESYDEANVYLDLVVDDEVQIVEIRQPTRSILDATSTIERVISFVSALLKEMRIPLAPILVGWLTQP